MRISCAPRIYYVVPMVVPTGRASPNSLQTQRPAPACAGRDGLRIESCLELPLPPRDHHGGETVADHVHRRARHVHQLVDAEDGENGPLGETERRRRAE